MLDELKEEYINSLPDKVEEIKKLLNDYRGGDKEAILKIRTLAHSLRGSGATYGFEQISDAGKKVEEAPGNELIRELANLIKVLQDAARDDAAASLQNILVIEDDADVAKVLTATIEKQPGNYRTLVAGTAAEAKQYLEKYDFSLVLLDLVLPDEDGRHILHTLKGGFNLSVPVIVLSAIARDQVRVECMALGADKFIVKPFDPETLVGEILKLIKDSKNKTLSLKPLNEEEREEAEGESKGAATVVADSGQTVLVAEDDRMQAKVIMQRLREEGFHVRHVENGKDALDELGKHSFALLILDVKMPVMDGFKVLERVRNELQLYMPVIMLTSMGNEEDIVRGYDLGADDYILKPFSKVQLVARVKSLLKG